MLDHTHDQKNPFPCTDQNPLADSSKFSIEKPRRENKEPQSPAGTVINVSVHQRLLAKHRGRHRKLTNEVVKKNTETGKKGIVL